MCILGPASLAIRAGEEKPEKPKAAEIAVKGLGFWKSREERSSLVRLLGEERGPAMDANAIEDAAFLLISGLTDEGFLRPTVKVIATPESGAPIDFVFDATLSTILPRPLAAKRVEFYVDRGVRSTFEAVAFTGLTLLTAEQATGFFKPVDTLWQSPVSRAYSPGRLRRAVDNLQDELRLRGYADAALHARVEKEDLATGDVDVVLEVNEGMRWVVSDLQVTGMEGTGAAVAVANWENRSWTMLWQQDLSEAIRRACVAKGFPDVTVKFERTLGPIGDGEQPVSVVAAVESGGKAIVGEVRFAGSGHTLDMVLRRRVRLKSGDPLDVLRVEQARMRLARLGVFSSVQTRFDPASGERRDVVFELTELPRWETNLIFGYGSYERLRGGVEWRQSNLFGRAHQSRLLLVQSLKSTRADYLYSVPELFGETLDGTARLFGLRREEQSFVREEYGANVALRRRLGRGTEGRVGYTYQALRNQDNELNTRAIDDELVKVGSVDFGVTLDRRDNPLRPRRGYRWFGQVESASTALGGEVDFQVFEGGASYHIAWGRSRWIHAGIAHGAITTFGSDNDRDLPVNKRFFPGGESTMRGYQRGEASPRGADGRFIGAKSQLTVNLEVEQGLTGNWSAVAFVDALGTAVSLSNYPFDEKLYSVGLGVRYQTIVGPVRLEYGHNLNPREGDPSGTLHFSVGFPF